MVTLGVLFTGFFVAALLRMTGGNKEGFRRTLQASPNRGGAPKGRRGLPPPLEGKEE